VGFAELLGEPVELIETSGWLLGPMLIPSVRAPYRTEVA
jgi:hypothetical protein